MAINQASVQGEESTGYLSGDFGPFKCGACEYFSAATSGCRQKDMRAKSKQPRLKNGDVRVDAADCCAYQEQVAGKKDDASPMLTLIVRYGGKNA